MNDLTTHDPEMPIDGVRPEFPVPQPIEWGLEAISGHSVTAAPQRPSIRCWSCSEVFPVSGHISVDIYYACPICCSLNQCRPANALRSAVREGSFDLKIPKPPAPPVKLDTVFMQGVDGWYEVPKSLAASFRVGSDRARELGHLPFNNASGGFGGGQDQEVKGHHKTPGGDAGDPNCWGYHITWEYGCFFDETGGGFAIGFHRHPYNDERAVAANPSDFA